MNGIQSQNILYLETLCQDLYSPKTQELRVKAEQLLDNAFPTFSETISSRTNGTTSNVSPLNVSPLGVKILSPVDTSMCCRWLLEKSNSPYALMFASARLKILYNALEACSNDTLSVQLELSDF
ncbi:9163_t:CDS:2 [Entrophospora sp. SA101]|nr:9163_t:CDS:2 [Entrophospora sp. SA101]